LFRTVLEALSHIAGSVPNGGEVLGIACASMGEACVLIDDAGKPVANAIAWFDRRTEAVTIELEQKLGQQRAFRIAGIQIDPTLTLPKLLWHRETAPDVFALVRKILNIADWIAFRLCGEAATDPSLASRTLCLDMAARDWSPEILQVAELDRALLPPIRPSGTQLGPVRQSVLAATGLPGRPVVAVGAHDHVCGGFAAGAGRPGVLLDSMGTAEALFQTVARPVLTEANRHVGFAQGIVGLHRSFSYFGTGINSSAAPSSGSAPCWRCRAQAAGARRADRGGRRRPARRPRHGIPAHLAYGTAPSVDRASRGAFLGLTAAPIGETCSVPCWRGWRWRRGWPSTRWPRNPARASRTRSG